MYLSNEDIKNLDRIKRLNIINSVSGIKPANLIGTADMDGKSNLAIFSSVVHLGSHPALLGMVVRPYDEVKRHTFENILDTGAFTINHVHEDFVKEAHYTSAKFDKSTSEFEKCGFKEEYLKDFEAPFVKSSKLKIGLRFVESVPIQTNNTRIIVGEIEHLILPDEAVSTEGYIDLGLIKDVGISGLNSYYSVDKIAQHPYARPEETPNFKEID